MVRVIFYFFSIYRMEKYSFSNLAGATQQLCPMYNNLAEES